MPKISTRKVNKERTQKSRKIVAHPRTSSKTALPPKKRRTLSNTKNAKIKKFRLTLEKAKENPILSPRKNYPWESEQTFNPAAIYENGNVHLVYRAIGNEGLSVFGYAQSKDGITIEDRSEYPIYVAHKLDDKKRQEAFYELLPFVSGGGFGGSEDPRLTRLGDRIYMLYVSFENYPRLAITSISVSDFLKKRWKWAGAQIISPPGIIDKSGCLFPEKINGKYAILHRIFPNILIDFVDSLDFKEGEYLKGEHQIKIRKSKWDSRKIGAGAPPIKTERGWLLLYYAVDDRDASKYKIGAMLLDLKDPKKVIARTDEPILEPVEPYENEGNKSGITYPCGAVVINKTLLVYYGGADTVVCVATAPLDEFLEKLAQGKRPKLTRNARSK